MSIGISLFGSRIALAVIVPYLLYTVIPMRGQPVDYSGGNILLQQMERAGMMGCALMTALSGSQTFGMAGILMVLSTILYDIVMIRYFFGGMDWKRESVLLIPRTALQLMVFIASALALADPVMTKFFFLLLIGSIGNAFVKRIRFIAWQRQHRRRNRRAVRRKAAVSSDARAVAMSCDASRPPKIRK